MEIYRGVYTLYAFNTYTHKCMYIAVFIQRSIIIHHRTFKLMCSFDHMIISH